MRKIAVAPLAQTWQGNGKALFQSFHKAAGHVILNKEKELRLSLICFLAQGHLLIEDIPGVGKTTFAKTLAHLLGLSFSRVQFTSDLLPADVIGTSVFDAGESEFRFHKGPLFAELVLADELNRATPRTQSALLQAMEERHITVDGQTFALPDPFFLVATQNPRFQIGTYPLPESQLDRFLMRIELGYPGVEAETDLLLHADSRQKADLLPAILNAEERQELRKLVTQVQVSEDIARYIQKLLQMSRRPDARFVGLSPRAGLGVVAAAKATAFLEGRNFVIFEDVQFVFTAIANHRLTQAEHSFQQAAALAQQLVESVEVE